MRNKAMSNENLLKFIDSVVSGDEEVQRQSLSLFAQEKTKQLLGLTTPEVSKTMEELSTKINSAINEEDLGNDITLDGNSVYVKGKRVGHLKYEGSDEAGDETQLYFVDLNGSKINILDNDIEAPNSRRWTTRSPATTTTGPAEQLMKVLTNKFLDNKK